MMSLTGIHYDFSPHRYDKKVKELQKRVSQIIF
nr:MAG TPA: hypothetical protein [Caudoviricetes sp.]